MRPCATSAPAPEAAGQGSGTKQQGAARRTAPQLRLASLTARRRSQTPGERWAEECWTGRRPVLAAMRTVWAWQDQGDALQRSSGCGCPRSLVPIGSPRCIPAAIVRANCQRATHSKHLCHSGQLLGVMRSGQAWQRVNVKGAGEMIVAALDAAAPVLFILFAG